MKNFFTPSKKDCSRGLWLPSCSEASNFLQQLLLLGAQAHRGLDHHAAKQVAGGAAAHRPRRPSRARETRGRTGSRWESSSTTSPSRVGTSTVPPSAAVVKLIGTSQDKMAALALEDGVLAHANLDIQVARRTAVAPGLALAGQVECDRPYRRPPAPSPAAIFSCRTRPCP